MKNLPPSEQKAELDRVIHQPTRTRILTFLMLSGECDYVSLRDALDLNDGLMSTHMRELLSKNYVSIKKEFVDRKPRTSYRLTREGRTRYCDYIEQLKALVKTVSN